jgi:hypothetical protein
VTGNSRTLVAALATALAIVVIVNAKAAETIPALKLKASVIGAPGAPVSPISIELFRWSTDVERAPLIAALQAPPPAPASAAPAAGAGRAGRAARGGRAAAPPPSPIERLTTAVKAAPTVGFIWGDGPTGYSIKYAWRSALPNAGERVVLVTDRRLGANQPSWPAAEAPAKAGAEVEFTVVELHIDGKGVGEAKSSLASSFAFDAAANTLAIDKYADAPVLLKVTR